MQNYHKIIIIGAGPVGLYFAIKCEKAGLDYLILEGSFEVGGQITHLYPEKEVVDLPGFAPLKAKEYIEYLAKQVPAEKILLDSKVLNIEKGNPVKISTKNNEFTCDKLIVATGLGAATPRPLGVEHEDEVENIIYNVNDYSYLKDKNVAIFGGGDSALDWAKHISAISDGVHLIHRRLEFRGNAETIKECKNLAIHLPYTPKSIEIKDGKAISVTIQKVESEELVTIPVDYIFVNYGNVARQSSFPFQMTGSFINVNESNNVEGNIYAIGDVAQYPNKKRRMAPGNIEADKVFELITD